MPPVDEILPGTAHVEIRSVAPRFEDKFIVMLKQREYTRSTDAQGLKKETFTPHETEDVITVKEVKRRFGSFCAVKGISFTVHHGEVFGLLGANGAGKSTTFRMLCGLLPASEGSLMVAGHDLRRTRGPGSGSHRIHGPAFFLFMPTSPFLKTFAFSAVPMDFAANGSEKESHGR